MTRLGRWVRNLLERYADTFHEGPEPPKRLGESVRLFRALHPNAGADEWEAFARQLADNTYRQAYTRGFEQAERFWPGPIDDPAILLEAEREDVSVAEMHPHLRLILELGYDPADPLAGLSNEERAAVMEGMRKGQTFSGRRM